MKIRDMGDGSVCIVETVKEINDKAVAMGLTPPIVVFSCPPYGELALETRMTLEEAQERGIVLK